MRKVLISIVIPVLAVIITAVTFVIYNTWDRHRGYLVDLDIKAPPEGRVLAGFAAMKITPEITDTWTDVKGNSRFMPEEGDTFKDITGSGNFDAVWLAGFSNRKAAKGVHDDLWARAMVLDDGQTRMAWVALDAIGLFGCDVIDIRKSIPGDLGIDYAIISSSHTHSAPDLLGMWGSSRIRSGVDPGYMDLVKRQSLAAIETAVQGLRPAKFRFAVDKENAAPMIRDTREPEVINPELRIMQVMDLECGTTLGTLVQWDNHPETVWSRNLMVTSDFPHYLREGIENGIWKGDSLITPGLGGIAMHVTGNIGGLMTTSPAVGIECSLTDTVYFEPSFDKVRAQGLSLAQMTITALNSSGIVEIETGSIELRARTVILPVDNRQFRLGAAIGLFSRGLTGWMRFRSEIAFWKFGPASFLHHPGELYPEIADGGIEAPDGQDFNTGPQEIPPLREIMPGHFKFITGLSNDMIGYIIPESQWDAEPPYTYGNERSPYGEINSLGPRTAPILHSEMKRLIEAGKH